MHGIEQRSRVSALAGIILLSLTTACPDSTKPPTVASVQMSTTYANPRVGEVANIVAKPVNDGGVEVPGVACAFSSSAPAVASVDPSSGTVQALAAGTAIITATCGGVAGTLTITVRPSLRTLELITAGSGSGSLFASPAGLSYDQGTSVTVTASAAAGSTFTGWSGACSGTAACVVVMDGNKTVTGTFGGQFTGTWVGTWSWSGPGANSCTFNNGGAFSMTLTQSGSAITGSITAAGLQVRDNATCAVTSTESAAGTASGTASGTTWTMAFALGGSQNSLNFSGTATVSATSLTSTFVRSTGGTGTFTLTRQ